MWPATNFLTTVFSRSWLATARVKCAIDLRAVGILAYRGRLGSGRFASRAARPMDNSPHEVAVAITLAGGVS